MDHSTTYDTQQVPYYETTDPIPTPSKDGYQFMGWYADPEYAAEFDFDQPISENKTIYAKWNKITVTSYTVRYIKESDGTNLFPPATYSGTVGRTVWANAKTSPDYIVDKISDSIVLVANAANNVITFTYSEPHDVWYKVVYEDMDGNLIREDAPLSTQANQIVVYADVAGMHALNYQPIVVRQTKVLADETDPNNLQNNIIVFKCLPRYTVTFEAGPGGSL